MIGILTMTYDMLDPNGNEVERRFTKEIDIDGVDGLAMMNADLSGDYRNITNPLSRRYDFLSETCKKFDVPPIQNLLSKHVFIEFPNGWKLYLRRDGESRSEWFSPGKGGFVW